MCVKRVARPAAHPARCPAEAVDKHVEISTPFSVAPTRPVDDYGAQIFSAKTVYATGLIPKTCSKHSKDTVLLRRQRLSSLGWLEKQAMVAHELL